MQKYLKKRQFSFFSVIYAMHIFYREKSGMLIFHFQSPKGVLQNVKNV